MSTIFTGKIVNGVLRIRDISSYNAHLKALEGEDVEFVVKKLTEPHRTSQRKLYWFYLRQIGAEIGQNPEELHEQFKEMFLTDREGTTPVVKSTMFLTKEEFQDYIEKIRRRVAEVGIILVEPGLGE